MKTRHPYYRTNAIPVKPIIGEYIVTENVITDTHRILLDYKKEGEMGHEGLVFWAGREFEDLTIFTTVVAPKTSHEPQRVMVSEKDFGRCSRTSRYQQTAILCQVHSHPGEFTIHSDGDDHLIIMPFDRMLSVVIPFYGKEFQNLSQSSIHQYQNRQWVYCDEDSVVSNVHIVPNLIDLRE